MCLDIFSIILDSKYFGFMLISDVETYKMHEFSI